MYEVEYKIIGTVLMVEQENRDRIFREVHPEYFEDKTTAEIFRRLAAVYNRYPTADSMTYTAALDADSQRDVLLAMQNLISPAIAAEQLDDTLAAFRNAWQQRQLKSKITDLALGNPTTADVLQLAEMVKGFSTKRTDNAAEYLQNYHAPIKIIGTGFPELDELLGSGLIAATLSTLGARPSTGKTTLAINIATFIALTQRVLFVSLEMAAGMIYDRIVADKANIKYSDCMQHRADFKTVCQVVESYQNLTIEDSISDIEDIVSLIHETKPDFVIIDYIQIVTSKFLFTDNRQRIDHISRLLKQTAKQTGAHILSLSQITRAGKDRPTMSDLKESGGLEQDSDYIMLLYREYVNDKSAQIKPEATTLTLDKNKFGRTGEIEMNFDGVHQRFTIADDVIARPHTEEQDGDLPF
ncbi:MAG: AAA family ATPase [Ruminococcus sp.]|nr:AAA family ATPase [Ruminococcus sp.]